MALFKRFLTSSKPINTQQSNNPYLNQGTETFNPRDTLVIEAGLAMISQEGLIMESLHLVQAGRGSTTLPFITSGDNLPILKSTTLITTYDFQEAIDIFLFRGNNPQTSRNTFIGAYRINGICAMARSHVHVDLYVMINGISGVKARQGVIQIAARNKFTRYPLTIEALPDQSFTIDEVNTRDFTFNDPPVQRVRAYIACLWNGSVVGYQTNGSWRLPGGLVIADDLPALPRQPNNLIFPLSHHIKTQTGLKLVGLTDPLSVILHPFEQNVEAVILYSGHTIGNLKNGVLLDPYRLPIFTDLDDPREDILWFIQQRQRDSLPPDSITDPISGALAGGIEGIFVSAKPPTIRTDGTPAYQFLRFYPDGLVLQTGLYCHDPIRDRQQIEQWFNREAQLELARGLYFMQGDDIWFNTSVYFNSTKQEITLDMIGKRMGPHLVLDVESRTEGLLASDVIFYRIGQE